MSSYGARSKKESVVTLANARFCRCSAIFAHVAWCAYLFARRNWQPQRVVARILDIHLRQDDLLSALGVRPNRPERAVSPPTALWRHAAPEYGVYCSKWRITSPARVDRPGRHHFRYLNAGSPRCIDHEEILAYGAQGVAMRPSHHHHGQSPAVRRDQAHAPPPAEPLRPARSNNRAVPR